MVPNKVDRSFCALPLPDLIEAAYRHLQSLDYSPNTCNGYRYIWNRLARSENTDVFSQQLADKFISSLGVHVDGPGRWRVTTCYQRQFCAATRILSEFAAHGSWCRRRITRIIDLPVQLQSLLDGYREHVLHNLGGALRTFTSRAPYLKHFLQFIQGHLGLEVAALKPAHLADFLARHEALSPETVAARTSTLKSFCRYLFMAGVLPRDLGVHLPALRIAHDRHIPTVWTHAQVEAILAAVDRGSPRGKRDYSILLLACRLAMRCEDIRRLCLEDLHWSDAQIVVRQSKTGRPLVLPLVADVGEALVDYLRCGRPQSKYREVFLRVNAPIEPLANNTALWNIMNNHRRLAGVVSPGGGPQGMHSLRHTVATRLLEAGTSLDTISQVLGHTSVESTRIYAKVDIEALRSAALSVEGVDHA